MERWDTNGVSDRKAKKLMARAIEQHERWRAMQWRIDGHGMESGGCLAEKFGAAAGGECWLAGTVMEWTI